MSGLKFENAQSTSNVRFKVTGEPSVESMQEALLNSIKARSEVGHKDRFARRDGEPGGKTKKD